jgi:hypothetical protein
VVAVSLKKKARQTIPVTFTRGEPAEVTIRLKRP